MLQGRQEADVLKSICNLIGHEAASFEVKSRREFSTICKYIASIDSDHDSRGSRDIPLCLHISAHGNDRELGFGLDDITWNELFNLIRPICAEMQHYKGDIYLVISACEASLQTLTKDISIEFCKNKKFNPPSWLFVTADKKPSWREAAVSWTIFYHLLPKTNLDNKHEVQVMLDKIKEIGAANIMYWRWDKRLKRYRKFSPAST